MTTRRAVALTLGLSVALLVTGCGSGGQRPAAQPSPPKVPGQASGPDLANVTLPDFSMPLVTGGVSQPSRDFTPGAIATKNTAAVCALPDHAGNSIIPVATQAAVYKEYGYTNPQVQSKYEIDYLVPIFLGGANTRANMWPAALKGTGFFEKIQLDHVLRDLVCHRTLPLFVAQKDLERNWYAAWLKFVVSTGRG
jgi:hypothetical protein